MTTAGVTQIALKPRFLIRWSPCTGSVQPPVSPLKSPPCQNAVDVGSNPVVLRPPVSPPVSFDGSPFAYRSVITK